MVKKFFKNIKAKCKGFSLMELIVTIAIMAVLAAVLAPALIHYVEDSRAAKDDHAMQEVVNAMNVALAYDDAYDEIIDDIAWKNSCYVDSDSPKNEHKELLFVDDNEESYQSYKYTDEERILDETPYKFNGRMYGATVTFRPNNDHVIEIKDAVYSGDGEDKKISEMSEENVLYTKIKQVIGNKIELTSATYKNSQYTIFICFGVEAEKTQNEYKVTLSDEPIVIYGQWNGTNLLTIEMQDPSLDDTPDFNVNSQSGVIPEGGSYQESVLVDNRPPTTEGNFPDEPIIGDTYIYGDYAYVYGAFSQASEPHTFPISSEYGYGYDPNMEGWRVLIYDPSGSNTLTYHSYFKQKDTYEPFLSSIAGKPVLTTEYMFYGSGAEINLFTLPKGEYKLDGIFYNYSSGVQISQIDFMGTISEWNQIVSRSSPSWYSGLINYQNMVIHCTDGDVCVYHNSSSFTQATSSFVDGNYHMTQGICTRCNQNISVQESHSGGTATCQAKKVCTGCSQEYGSLGSHNYVANSGATWTYSSSSQHRKNATCSICGTSGYVYGSHSGGTATTCGSYKTCTSCNHTYGSAVSHNYVANSGATWTYYTSSQHKKAAKCSKCGTSGYVYASHTGGTATCTTAKTCSTCNHSYGSALGHNYTGFSCDKPSICSRCSAEGPVSNDHNIVNGTCSKCGKVTNQIVITQNDVYKNSLGLVKIGSWKFDNATSVTISFSGNIENGYDWVAFTPDSTFTNGSTSNREWINYDGTTTTTSLPISSIHSGEHYKTRIFTGALSSQASITTNETSGIVVFRTDGSVLGDFTITITPNP